MHRKFPKNFIHNVNIIEINFANTMALYAPIDCIKADLDDTNLAYHCRMRFFERELRIIVIIIIIISY